MTSVTFKQDTAVKAPAYLEVKDLSSLSGFVSVTHFYPDVLDAVALQKNTQADIYITSVLTKSDSSTFSQLLLLQIYYLFNLLFISEYTGRG